MRAVRYHTMSMKTKVDACRKLRNVTASSLYVSNARCRAVRTLMAPKQPAMIVKYVVKRDRLQRLSRAAACALYNTTNNTQTMIQASSEL